MQMHVTTIIHASKTVLQAIKSVNSFIIYSINVCQLQWEYESDYMDWTDYVDITCF